MMFAELASWLERHYAVASPQSSAFRNRLRHLQKIGWPKGSRTGRGRAATYTPWMAAEVFFVTELCAAGIYPERAIEIVEANLPNLHAALERGERCELRVPPAFGERVPSAVISIDVSPAFDFMLEA